MRHILVIFCALAVASAACAQEVFAVPDGGPCGPPLDIVIPGSGYSSYAQVFPPGCCYSRYATPFPPGFGYSAYGRIIPTPGHGCDGLLPMVPLFAETIPPPAGPSER